MQNENNYTVGQWCDRWFCENQGRWSGSTVGGYRNLIYRHILPGIEGVPLAELTEDTVTSFYDSLQSQGLSARSVWCVHLLLRRCMDEAARDQCIHYNPVRLCQEPQAEEHNGPFTPGAAPAVSECRGTAWRIPSHLHRTLQRPTAM